MNKTIEQLYQEIGKSALENTDSLSGKILVYAEVEDGAISADMLYVNRANVVRLKFCPGSMQVMIYALWERWKEEPGNVEWRVLCYVIEGGKFSIDLTYPDQLNEEETVSDRRPRVIKKYFGDAKVDYSQPN